MKKIFTVVVIGCITLFNSAFAIAPTFDRDFKRHLVTDPSGKNETVYNPSTFRISANSTLRDNVFNVFSPTNNNSVLWNVVRIVMIGVLVLYFAWIGIDFMMHPNDPAKNKQARMGFLYLLFGAFLVYGVTWIL